MAPSRSVILARNNNKGVCKFSKKIVKSSSVQGKKGKIWRPFALSKRSLIRILEESVDHKSPEIEYPPPIIEAPVRVSNTLIDEFANVSIDDLRELETLGAGSYGRVSLVTIRGDRTRTFALKQIKKAKIVQLQQQHHILSERAIMNQINSDFVVKLYKTFKDAKYVYMLIESCMGGELAMILQQQKRLQQPAAKFYIACVVKAFEHLHSMNIVYRDLKPENLLIDRRGYLKMADFGFAKKLDFDQQTDTICGTAEYMAPEVIEDKNHDIRCDYWSLGVIVYELLVGRTPFRDPGFNRAQIYASIVKGFQGREFPGEVTSEAEALILSLYRMDPAKRLDGGSIGQMVPISEWFRGFDWEALTARTMAPPIVPEIVPAISSIAPQMMKIHLLTIFLDGMLTFNLSYLSTLTSNLYSYF